LVNLLAQARAKPGQCKGSLWLQQQWTGTNVLFSRAKKCLGSYELYWSGCPHPGGHGHHLKTLLRDGENISCLHLGRSRKVPCFRRDETTSKFLLLFSVPAGCGGLDAGEKFSQFPLVHPVPCSGTTKICAKRQFRLGKGYSIFLYLCFLSHFVKRGHVACNEDICSFCRKL